MPRRRGKPAQVVRIHSASDHAMHCYDWAVWHYKHLVGIAVDALLDSSPGSLALAKPENFMPSINAAMRYWDAVQGRPNIRR